MFNKQTVKSRAGKRKQAVRGKLVKKRNIGKITNRLKENLLLLWRPKLLSGLSALVIAIIAYQSINLDQVLPIETVKIEGEFDFLNKEKLRQKTLPVLVGGFFNVNLSNVRNELITLPWVEDVSVRRQWPNSLLVRVIEKKPVVLWGDKGVISARAELFTPVKKPQFLLPLLRGPEGQHKTMLKELARMQAWLLDTGLMIKKMELDERRSWTLVMTNGMELRLGREQIHERLNRFVDVYKDTLGTKKREIKHIDMRYTNGFAVAWAGA